MTLLTWIALTLAAGAWFALRRHARRIEDLESEILRLNLDLRRQQAARENAIPAAPSIATAPGSTPVPVPAPAHVPVRPPTSISSAASPSSIPVPAQPPAPEHIVLPPPLPAVARVVPRPQPAAEEATEAPASPAPTASETFKPFPMPSAPRRIDWEQFLGVKLFAWLGGFALFLAAAFFLKYSFEHDLIPPAVRAALGYVAALGLVGGGLWIRHRGFETLASTLVGTGVVILYAVTFACRALYEFPFFGPVPTFLLMALITAGAFTLAIRLSAQVIGVLGLLGGFLTPALVSTGVDNPPALFGYITILNLGLFAMIWKRQWDSLATLAAIATVGVELGWMLRFYRPEKLFVLQVILPLFPALFAGFFAVMERTRRESHWITAALVIPAAFSLLHGFAPAATESGDQILRYFAIWLTVDAVVLGAVLWIGRPSWVEPAAGMLVFLLLAVWTLSSADASHLFAGLAVYFLFTVLHTVLPLLRLRKHPEERPGLASQLIPAAVLGLFVLLQFRDIQTLPTFYWLGILAIDAVALLLAAFAGTLLVAIGVLVVSAIAVAATLLRGGPVVLELDEALLIVGGFTATFVLGGWWLARRQSSFVLGIAPVGTASDPAPSPILAISGTGSVLPFLLVSMLAVHTPTTSLHPMFAMITALVGVVLVLSRVTGFHALGMFALAGTALFESTWLLRNHDAAALPAIGWQVGIYGLFLAFPFLIEGNRTERRLPWLTAACAGPVQFLAVYLTARETGPMSYAGLIPAAFAVPALAVLTWLARRWPAESTNRLGVLSTQAGVALLFITLIFPIQFRREWLTLAWALEGAALLWLFRRLPHPGLRLVGITLLATAFARLMFNPAVLDYHVRTGTPILNWYLYTYSVAAAAMFAGAGLLRPGSESFRGVDLRGVLRALGAVLLFALLNIEIADFFAEGSTLTFDFTGNFARDLSYTIGWALFALGLVVIGIARSSRSTRYSGIGLLAITLLKLFFHDLARLDQLYRIGAFAGVAVIAIVASFLYQRFLNRNPHSSGTPPA